MYVPIGHTGSDHNPPATDRQAPKLLDKLRMLLESRRYRPDTVPRFVEWLRQFILFHHKRHPATMGREEIETFLDHLGQSGYGVGLQAQARQALAFLYREVLGQTVPWPEIARLRPEAESSFPGAQPPKLLDRA